MKVVKGFPPNYDAICAKLGRPPANAVYCWGDTLYVPNGGQPDPVLLAHERTHVWQQQAFGGPEKWWERYLADPVFRMQQELQAYREQYALAREKLGREDRRRYARKLASDFAGSMYGHLLRKERALELITA